MEVFIPQRQTLMQIFLLLGLFVMVTLSGNEAKAFKEAPQNNPFYYISPRPGANYVAPGTSILLRTEQFAVTELLHSSSLKIEGSKSGAHAGEVELAGDGRTLIFQPRTPFTPGESVQVTIALPQPEAHAAGARPFTFAFTVTAPAAEFSEREFSKELQQPLIQSRPQAEPEEPIPPFEFLTAPPDLPAVAVERQPGKLGKGYLFVSAYNTVKLEADTAYTLILDNEGQPVYYARPLELPAIVDFKKQTNGLLTYFASGTSINRFYGLNQQYEVEDEYQARNGYPTDLHDLQILENGHKLMLAFDPQLVDMSGLVDGGSTEAPVIGCVVQELDQDDKVLFQWRSWDHIDILDTNRPLDSIPLRYIHCNSVELDSDGHLLISSRHLDQITKINRQTGEIIWRLGGRRNDFIFTNDYGFSYQHDARRLPNGNLTVYDNGVTHNPRHSRGIEYLVDETNMIAVKVAEYRNTPETYALSMGNMQTLPNGNRVIGWGRSSTPMLTEFDKDGNKLLEFTTEYPIVSYRAFRFPWQGYPTWPPVLATRLEGENLAHLHFSWNGSTETVSYKIYAGRWRDHLRYVTTVFRDGFETVYTYEVPRLGFWYFQVVPVNSDSIDGPPSNVAHVVRGGESTYMSFVAAP